MSDTPETDALILLKDGFGVTDYELRQHSRRLERERDEAREKAQRLRVQLNHYTQANEMAEQAFRERDEAHKIAERAIDDLAWFNESNAQVLSNELGQLTEGAK